MYLVILIILIWQQFFASVGIEKSNLELIYEYLDNVFIYQNLNQNYIGVLIYAKHVLIMVGYGYSMNRRVISI